MPHTDRRAVRRGGFALPWTLFVLVFLGVLAGTGFLVVWLERRSAATHVIGTDAFDAAEAGLAMAMAAPGLPTGTGARFPLSGTPADVTFETLLELPGGAALVAIESTASIVDRGSPTARTVGRVAWMGAPPQPGAALSATEDVTAGAASGFVRGGPPASCPGAAAAGVLAWGTVAAGAVAVTGSPPMVRPSASQSPASIAGLRWPDLTSGATAAPDAVVPPDPWPSGGAGWTYVRIRGAARVGPGHSGRGLIVAEGDLELEHGFAWRGLVLAGGSLRISGDVDLRGAVFAGLDPALPGFLDLGDGALAIELDRCAAGAAALRIRPYPAAIPGTGYERW